MGKFWGSCVTSLIVRQIGRFSSSCLQFSQKGLGTTVQSFLTMVSVGFPIRLGRGEKNILYLGCIVLNRSSALTEWLSYSQARTCPTKAV